jgi:hypothetical protein
MVASSIATSTGKWTCNLASAYRQLGPEPLHRCASPKAPAAAPAADGGPWLQYAKHPRSRAGQSVVLGSPKGPRQYNPPADDPGLG